VLYFSNTSFESSYGKPSIFYKSFIDKMSFILTIPVLSLPMVKPAFYISVIDKMSFILTIPVLSLPMVKSAFYIKVLLIR
jgi:hypothetical protein